jgi:8-amino-7-oxononanoate synthase
MKRTPWEEQLRAELAGRAAQGLRRELRVTARGAGNRATVAGKELLQFASNDYLGLARHPALIDAARAAAARYGAGAGASRLVTGTLPIHAELDEAVAAFKELPAALVFSTGYAAAVGAIPALVGAGDAVLLDKRAHASLIDGARLSGALLRVFPHNDLGYLEKLLRNTAASRRVLIVTESVFSMDGDRAPLREIAALKEKHGAWLMVDEAHAAGIFGPRRRGVIEEEGLSDQVEVQMGTLSKAFGSSGGYVAGSRLLVDCLVHGARSLIYSTAPSPAVCGASLAALALVQGAEGEARRRLLWERTARFAEATGLPGTSPIFPLVYGAEEAALAASAALAEWGIAVPPIRYPTVARGRARLRVTVTAATAPEELEALISALAAAPGYVR